MSEQNSLNLEENQTLESVNEYKFEPIKGYPMLNWRGKRPFTATQFFPAQKKEEYGEDINGWLNKIFWGDNLQVMSHLLKEYRGKVDLIYIDPPFDSKADYKKTIKLKNQMISNDTTSFEEKQYTDLWSNDEYLQFMYERLILMKELLSIKGSIYLHCDWHKSHYLRNIMDEIFGVDNFKNEIVWLYKTGGASKESWAKKHDTILFYAKEDGKHVFNLQKERSYMMHKYGFSKSEFQVDPANGLQYTMVYCRDVWDMPSVGSATSERVDYPTQKPEILLERVLKASSNPNDLVFDCFMGSGTTQAVSMKLGRRFIVADINLGAVQTTTKRLIKVAEEIKHNKKLIKDEEVTKYTGFEVYNVNNYDIFRNPVEAKDILIEALEIQKLEANSIYDGEKDERMVKIMPVNRIATKADLNELINGFNYKAWERKQEEAPNKTVEKLLLICMGHEPDLKAALELAVKPYKIDVEVVDILRDKSQLEFKRDSSAKLVIEKDELVIESFYPMNLLQKLSLQKEQVDDWRELVESIMVDWNYDGAILQPTIIDIPEKNELVKGCYKIPEEAGTIRVKITDLLSESWEGNIDG